MNVSQPIKLKDLGKWRGGGTPTRSNKDYWQGGTIPWVSPKDMKVREIKTAQDQITPLALDESSAKLIPAGSLLMVTRSGILKHSFPVAINRVPVAVNQDLKAITPRDDIDSEFLLLALEAAESEILQTCTKAGTTVASIQTKLLKNFSVEIPTLKQQQQVVKEVRERRDRIRASANHLEAIPDLIERFRQSVLAAAFRGDLTKEWREQNPDVEPASVLLERIRAERRERYIEDYAEAKALKAGKPWTDEDDEKVLAKERVKAAKKYKEPEIPTGPESIDASVFADLAKNGWVQAPMEALADPVRSIPYGIVKTGDATAGGVPTVRCGDIRNFSIDIPRLKCVHPSIHEQYSRTQLRGGEVLIAIRGTVGGTAVVPTSMVGMNISREVAMVPVLPGVIPDYLSFLLASPAGQALMQGHVKGVAQSGINLGDLRSLPVSLPSTEEQQAIVEVVEGFLAQIDCLEQTLRHTTSTVAKLSQAVLAAAFSR